MRSAVRQFPLFVDGFKSGGFAKEQRRSGRPASAGSDILTELCRRYPGIKVYGGGEKVAGLTNLVRFLLASPTRRADSIERSRELTSTCRKQVKDNDTFKIGSLDVKAVFTPCQLVNYLRRPRREESYRRLTLLARLSTQDHICYFVEDKQKNQRAVFTGCAADRSEIFPTRRLKRTGLSQRHSVY